MFFSTYVLTKKGPLAKVWLAAHWDKRLTRHEVKVVNLTQTIVHIIRPVVPIALRTSGELLVGVVRIYALKVKHLLREANDAVLLLRMASITVKGTGVQRVSGQSKWLWSNGAETPQDKATRMITSKDMNGGEIGAEDIERATIEGPGSANAAGTGSSAALYQSEVHAVTYDWGNTIAAAAATTTTSASLHQHRRSEVSAAGVAAANTTNSSDEAAFRAIADLLQPGSSHERPFTSSAAHATATAAAASQVSSSAAAGNALTAWYTMEPSSQDAALTGNGAGGMYASQSQAYEEIARMRADLMAMQPQQKEGTAFPWLSAGAQRESSTSQSSGSLARANGAPRGLGSIEFARGSAGGEYNNTGLPYPLPLPYPNGDEELDIGVPLPELEEQDRLLHGNGGNMTPGREGDVAGGRPSGFPFYNPNALTSNAPLHPSATTTTTQAHTTNNTMMPVIDLTSTTLSRAVVERTMKECGDILLKAPRRGPYTMDELQDRCFVLAASAPQSSSANSNGNEIWLRLLPRTPLSRSVFSCAQMTSPLSEAYSKALEAPLQTTCATLRERLAARKANMNMNMIARNNAAGRSPQYTSGADEIPTEGLEAFLAMTSHDAPGEDGAATSTRKRLREGSLSSSSSSEAERLTALSATANRTLQRIRATIEHDEATGANKRLRREGSATESASCTLERICTGLRRREAARTFVDILALASCSLLRAEQTSMDRGEVRLTLREGASLNNNNNDRAGVAAAAAERGRDVPAAVVAAAA